MSQTRAPTRRKCGKLTTLLLAIAAGWPGAGRAGPEVGSEYQMKAAQICSFTRFIDWPAKKFPTSESPFIIGVYGSDEITDFLRESFQSRRIKDRPVEIRHLSTKAELVPCHLVFVSRSERDRLGTVLYEMRRENILSVGESDNFLRSGGVISFLNVDGATRFEINLGAARRESLKVSPKLLLISYPANGGPRLPPVTSP